MWYHDGNISGEAIKVRRETNSYDHNRVSSVSTEDYYEIHTPYGIFLKSALEVKMDNSGNLAPSGYRDCRG